MNKGRRDFLHQAKKNKKDEFYTQFEDIKRELQHYTVHFKGKTVLCNCDDPTHSNFYKYFAINFKDLQLKKLIASCFVDGENGEDRGFYYTYTGRSDEKLIPDKEDVTYFEGNGDFRSDEVVQLLKEADIVVTNPPFSLFRSFVEQLSFYKKQFLIIGNINALTYKDIFEMIKNNQVWMGIHMGRGISGFIVPKRYELYGTEVTVDKDGNSIISPNNCMWLTNLDNFKRHTDIELTRTYTGNEESYPTYDNYDGINVNKTKDIPRDYPGAIGVPITFLHKFNPKQFDIIKFRKGDDEKDLSVNGKCPYFRILIKHRKVVV